MTLDEAYEVLDCLGQLTNDPEAFVWFAFDWDHDPELQGMRPQEWQLEQLRKIGQGLQTPDEVIRQAVSSLSLIHIFNYFPLAHFFTSSYIDDTIFLTHSAII